MLVASSQDDALVLELLALEIALNDPRTTGASMPIAHEREYIVTMMLKHPFAPMTRGKSMVVTDSTPERAAERAAKSIIEVVGGACTLEVGNGGLGSPVLFEVTSSVAYKVTPIGPHALPGRRP